MLDSEFMLRLRAHLSSLAALWLCCQAVALSAAPVVFATTWTRTEVACECPDAESGRACPMHESADATGGDSKNCHLRGTCMPADVALLTLVDGTAVLQHPLADASELVTTVIEPATFDLDIRSDIPDLPPPRA